MKKTLNFIVLIMAALVLVSCESNAPELNDHNRQLLIGRWEVVKETVTNGDGFGGEFTREGKGLIGTTTYEFSATQLFYEAISTNKDYGEFHHVDTCDYSLQQNTDKTWLLTAHGRFDKKPNLKRGYSPITIRKITDNKIEWEYQSYGGDEGPVGYYQYLKRIENN